MTLRTVRYPIHVPGLQNPDREREGRANTKATGAELVYVSFLSLLSWSSHLGVSGEHRVCVFDRIVLKLA